MMMSTPFVFGIVENSTRIMWWTVAISEWPSVKIYQENP